MLDSVAYAMADQNLFCTSLPDSRSTRVFLGRFVNPMSYSRIDLLFTSRDVGYYLSDIVCLCIGQVTNIDVRVRVRVREYHHVRTAGFH